MFATISFALGILGAILLLSFTRRHKPDVDGPVPRPTVLGWWTLAFGLGAVTALLLAMRMTSSGPGPDRAFVFWNLSIGFGFAAVVAGIGNLKMHDRRWPTWLGLAAGLIPVIFWILFAAGYILGIGE